MKVKYLKLKALAKLLRLAKIEETLIQCLDELLTESEVDKLHERVRVLERLKKGDSQREAAQKSGAAIATVSRGASLVKHQNLALFDLMEEANQRSWWQTLFWRA